MKLWTILISVLMLSLWTGCDDGGDDDPCGNNLLEEGEECDSNNFDNQSCATLGYYAGQLFCNDDCTFNTNDCAASGWCGDGVIQGDNEECDGDNLGASSCMEEGFSGGDLGCNEN